MRKYERDGYIIIVQQPNGMYLIGDDKGQLNIVDEKYLDEHPASLYLCLIPTEKAKVVINSQEYPGRIMSIEIHTRDLPDGSKLRCGFAEGYWIVDRSEAMKRAYG